MNKDDKKKNISVSIHDDLINLVKKYCEDNNIKKSKFIENVLKEYFNKKIINN